MQYFDTYENIFLILYLEFCNYKIRIVLFLTKMFKNFQIADVIQDQSDAGFRKKLT